ncbi:amidohydrolase family protein [Virgibacillus necropolis]|uniref:amidohydrolase family protein n=1 Tax=Virgibacillus necropolis TaxID=163877 RepID=UPI002220E186|nr:amidohydrolase family protein [Virgibacillus necropolis]
MTRQDYGWLTEEQAILYRDYLPHDLEPLIRQHGIDRTIVVQAAPTIEETEFLLELYSKYDFIAGVVGWLDLESPSFKDDYHRLREQVGFVGIRPMLHDLNDDRWIVRQEVMKNIELLVSDDFPLDLLIYPRHLPVVLELLEQFPQLRAVINHAAKPAIKNVITPFWIENMNKIASYENVMCKISGLITEADHQNWKHEDFRPFIQHLVHVFGIDRLMFGSDWPVCLLAGSYQNVYELFQNSLLQDLSEKEYIKIIGENASEFYRLNL